MCMCAWWSRKVTILHWSIFIYISLYVSYLHAKGTITDTFISIFYFFLLLFTIPNVGLTPPGLITQMPVDQMPVRRSKIWTRTLDKSTRAVLPESVVSRMAVPPAETTQYRTQTQDTLPVLGKTLKSLTLPGIGPWPPGWKAGILPTTPQRRDGPSLSRFKISSSLGTLVQFIF